MNSIASRNTRTTRRIPNGKPLIAQRSKSGDRSRNGLSSSKKPSELFKRLNPNALVSMIIEAAKTGVQENGDNVNGTCQDKNAMDPLENGVTAVDLSSSSAANQQQQNSVITGVGESDLLNNDDIHQERRHPHHHPVIDTTRPYLLLDVRDEDAYRKCRIITALNYPSSMLARMFNYESRPLAAYKNVPGKLIVFYDDMETDAPRVASTLYERGYDNVHVLTGGLKSLYNSYPEGVITGTLPLHILRSSPAPTRAVTRNPSSSRLTTTLSNSMARSVSTPSIAAKLLQQQKQQQQPSAVSDKKTHQNTNGVKKASSSWNSKEKGGGLKETFGEEELTLLNRRLQFNLLPKMKRGTLVSATAASKAGQSTTRDESQGQKETGGKARISRSLSKPWY